MLFGVLLVFCYYCCRFYYHQEDHASIPNIVQRSAEMLVRFPQIIHDFSSKVILNYIIKTGYICGLSKL